jgi:hypothetical protein
LLYMSDPNVVASMYVIRIAFESIFFNGLIDDVLAKELNDMIMKKATAIVDNVFFIALFFC